MINTIIDPIIYFKEHNSYCFVPLPNGWCFTKVNNIKCRDLMTLAIVSQGYLSQQQSLCGVGHFLTMIWGVIRTSYRQDMALAERNCI